LQTNLQLIENIFSIMGLPVINQRIQTLIDTKASGSVRKFAQLAGISSSQKLNRIFHKDKRSDKYPEPSLDMITSIANKFSDIKLDWLLARENVSMELKEEGVAYGKESNLPKLVTVDPEGNENILMVPVPAQAGYLHGFEDPNYLQSLPSYRLPKLHNGTFRMFEVKGHSMFPTIHSGAIAVGEWCENWYEDIKDNQIYIIVSKEDGIIIKRVLNRLEKYGNLFVKSDNRSEFPSYPVNPEDILEIWTLKTAFIFDFQDPADMYDRVNDLEAEMLNLKSLLPAKN